MSLENKVVAVTGASSGIGEAIARELAKGGSIVMLAARREERLKSQAQEHGDKDAYHVTAVTKVPQMLAMVKAA